MGFEKILRNINHDSKSVFVSYARGVDEDRRFIPPLLQWLHKNRYEVVSCDCPESDWPEMMKAAMVCRNAVLVSTEKYAYTCLMGHIKSKIPYAKYPSFAVSMQTDAPGQSFPGIEYAFKVAATVYGMIENEDERLGADKVVLLCDMLTGENCETGQLRYYFSDDYCLEENQTIIRNEGHFARIVTLFRSGEDCICRYPIIDCSRNRDLERSFSELSLYLKSEPSKRLKQLERPQILRVVSGSKKGAGGTSPLDHVVFWRLSKRHVHAMVPSLYKGEFKGTANTILRDWEALRK